MILLLLNLEQYNYNIMIPGSYLNTIIIDVFISRFNAITSTVFDTSLSQSHNIVIEHVFHTTTNHKPPIQKLFLHPNFECLRYYNGYIFQRESEHTNIIITFLL